MELFIAHFTYSLLLVGGIILLRIYIIAHYITDYAKQISS